VHEFNRDAAPARGISPVFGLRYYLDWPHSRALWPDMMFWVHFLDHPQCGDDDRLAPVAQAPLHK
jgi:hypothetical protein